MHCTEVVLDNTSISNMLAGHSSLKKVWKKIDAQLLSANIWMRNEEAQDVAMAIRHLLTKSKRWQWLSGGGDYQGGLVSVADVAGTSSYSGVREEVGLYWLKATGTPH